MAVTAHPPYPEEPTLPLFRREVRERLSLTALDLLLQHAEIFVEGGASSGSSAGGAFFGSAMLTIDLRHERLRLPQDEAMCRRLCEALHDDARARKAVVQRALEIGRARMDLPDDVRAGQLRCRVDDHKLLVDLDLESGPCLESGSAKEQP
ncbi:MAG: hypothetical protein ABI321_00645 [Polyangia bacterium]